jgi:UDP-2,3-diacylglucosamine hydrolase
MATLLASDLHLDRDAPWAIDAFLRFLQGPALEAEALYLLGDLFEAWVGDDDDDTDHARVCDALARLTRTGVPVYALHGNRDFLLGETFERRTGVKLLPDPVLVQLHGTPTLLSHGDVFCTEDTSYQELRDIVRKPAWQRRFLALPLDARRQLASAARAGSKAHTQRTIPTIMDVDPGAVTRAFRATGARASSASCWPRGTRRRAASAWIRAARAPSRCRAEPGRAAPQAGGPRLWRAVLVPPQAGGPE